MISQSIRRRVLGSAKKIFTLSSTSGSKVYASASSKYYDILRLDGDYATSDELSNFSIVSVTNGATASIVLQNSRCQLYLSWPANTNTSSNRTFVVTIRYKGQEKTFSQDQYYDIERTVKSYYYNLNLAFSGIPSSISDEEDHISNYFSADSISTTLSGSVKFTTTYDSGTQRESAITSISGTPINDTYFSIDLTFSNEVAKSIRISFHYYGMNGAYVNSIWSRLAQIFYETRDSSAITTTTLGGGVYRISGSGLVSLNMITAGAGGGNSANSKVNSLECNDTATKNNIGRMAYSFKYDTSGSYNVVSEISISFSAA